MSLRGRKGQEAPLSPWPSSHPTLGSCHSRETGLAILGFLGSWAGGPIGGPCAQLPSVVQACSISALQSHTFTSGGSVLNRSTRPLCLSRGNSRQLPCSTVWVRLYVQPAHPRGQQLQHVLAQVQDLQLPALEELRRGGECLDPVGGDG